MKKSIYANIQSTAHFAGSFIRIKLPAELISDNMGQSEKLYALQHYLWANPKLEKRINKKLCGMSDCCCGGFARSQIDFD